MDRSFSSTARPVLRPLCCAVLYVCVAPLSGLTIWREMRDRAHGVKLSWALQDDC